MWLDLENIMLSKIRQRKTNTVYHLYVESKNIIQMYVQNRNRLTDIENKLVITKGEREWGREKLRVWD